MKAKYPIYIISKGRWKTPLTALSLEEMGQEYRICVEPKEYGEYKSALPKERIIKLPDNFSEMGRGSIPVRNWVWDDAVKMGIARHWIMDDNIEQFNRLNNNLQVKVITPSIFKASEDFVDRYKNIGLSGFQYDFFAKAKTVLPAFHLNTRIYSCTLIKNDLPFRWRGKYNEDTDLSLRVLKKGLCTVLFYAFIQQKTQTMRMKGGNTDTIYNKTNDRLEFAQSLVDQHPDVARVTRKFGRWHHHVDYSSFKRNRLIKKEGLEIPDKINEYGMKLIKL